MSRGLDITIAFISSTALIFNLSTYILPIQINKAFFNIITIIPNYDGTPSLEFAFNGKCYADNIRVACLESMIELTKPGLTGYDDTETFDQAHGYYKLMKLLVASYSIFHGLLLVSCYSLLAYDLARTEKTNCQSCQRKIIAGYRKFAAICMEVTTVAGLAASGIGLSFALNLTSEATQIGMFDSKIGSGWILNLLATIGYFIATVWFTLPATTTQDVGCQAPSLPFEGMSYEKSRGHIVLQTV